MTPSFIITLLRNNLLVAVILFFFLGVVFVGLAYQDHLANIDMIEARHMEHQRTALAGKVEWFKEFIKNEKELGEKALKIRLRDKVDEGARIVSSIVETASSQTQPDELIALAREALRPIRFLNGRGYFFMFDLKGVELLFAVKPEMEGKNMLDITGKAVNHVVKDMISIGTNQGEGFYTYKWTKPGVAGDDHPKLSFVKLIPELQVILGAGEYLDDYTAGIQKHVLDTLENISPETDQYFFAGTFMGISLLGPARGEDMIHVTDVNGVEVVRELIYAAKNGGGFVTYTLPAIDKDYETYRKLSYTSPLYDWRWYIGAGTSLQVIKEELEKQRIQMVWRLFKHIGAALFIVFVISVSSYFLTRRVVIKVKDNIDSLSDSFEKATKAGAELSSSDATYAEFERVKNSANQMILFQKEARHMETVLLEINQHSQSSRSLDELLESIHQIMLRELGAENFFVALVNDEKDSLEFEYCMDSTVTTCPVVENISDPEQKRLSLYPIRQNKQVLFSKTELENLRNTGELYIHGVLPETWLGVPLRVRGVTMGVMVIQDYSKPNSYSWMDQQLIDACSDQIALGIERKRAEETLALAKNEFESIFNNSQVGIMLLRGGRIFYRGNQRLADILGYNTPDDMAGISMFDLHLSEEDFITFGKEFFYRLSQEDMIHVEYQLKRKNGTPVWCSLSGKALNPANLDEGVVWVLDDLEPRKTMETQLKDVAEAAEAASRAKSEFLANMSHEIRTPMNGVLGMLQLIQTTSLDEEQADYVQTAIQSSKRLTQLLTDILDLSRVEAGKLSITEEPFDLEDVLRQSIELFMPTAQHAQLNLKLDMAPDLTQHVIGDPYRLQQVLANLIGNALKFTQAGGVTVEARRHVDGGADHHTILFSVTDTGIGIPEDQIEQLFSPFMQADEGFSRKFQGAGLGLSICKRLVDLMGGEIDLHSQVNKGTTVSFKLELAPAPAPEPPRITTLQSLSPFTPSILLAEDDRVSSISTKKLMEKLGCEVMVASDGFQTLEMLKTQQFDAIFMDVQMPRMDGVKATQAIRNGEAGEQNTDIPIVALTAYAMSGDKESFLASGMTDYLSKPLDVAILEAMLAKLFS